MHFTKIALAAVGLASLSACGGGATEENNTAAMDANMSADANMMMDANMMATDMNAMNGTDMNMSMNGTDMNMGMNGTMNDTNMTGTNTTTGTGNTTNTM